MVEGDPFSRSPSLCRACFSRTKKTRKKKLLQSAWSASPGGSGTTSTTPTGTDSSRIGTGWVGSGLSWRLPEGKGRGKAAASGWSRCILFLFLFSFCFFLSKLSLSLCFARSQPPESPKPPPLPQVGCGVGNAALPLLEVLSPPAPIYACDFSATAIGILRRAPAALRSGGRLRAFVADAARPGALLQDSESHAFPPIERHSLAAATLIFALSAMSPAAMVAAVENVKSVLSSNGGRAFVRDYAVGDMASARLAGRSTPRRLHAWLPAAAAGDGGTGEGAFKENTGGEGDACARAEAAASLLSGGEFFARGDGTRAFYFSEGGLRRLFEAAGFVTESIGTVHMTKENRATRENMPRKSGPGCVSARRREESRGHPRPDGSSFDEADQNDDGDDDERDNPNRRRKRGRSGSWFGEESGSFTLQARVARLGR